VSDKDPVNGGNAENKLELVVVEPKKAGFEMVAKGAATALTEYQGPCPDLVVAVAQQTVSFEQVCEAYFGRHDCDDVDPRKAEYVRLFPQLQVIYSGAHLGTTTYFTELDSHLRNGVAVSDDRFDLVYDAGLAPSNTLYLLGWLNRINIESRVLLKKETLAAYNQLAYSAATKVLSVMEYQKDAGANANRAELSDRIKVAESTVRDAEDFATRTSQTIARSAYSKGLLAGMGLLCVMALILNGLLPSLDWISPSDAHFVFYSILTGGVGATVSFLARAGTIKFDYEVGRGQLAFFGVFRPLVGGIFGFILAALIRSRVVNFVTIPDAAQALYYYAAVAFLGGFSERLVPGILQSAERRFNLTGSKSTGPKKQ
jgi:hypothetical protein